MANGKPTTNTFDEYRSLTEEQKEYYTFEQLRKIDALYQKMNSLDQHYARKWTERIVMGFIGMVLVAFAGALIAGVIPNV